MDELFSAAGTLATAYAGVDWSATSLGPVETWDRDLRSAVDLTLGSGFPVTLIWGEDRVMIYNEGYVELIGEKHPAALGARCQDAFPEAWDVIGPLLEGVTAGNGGTFAADQLFTIDRFGFLEETYFTFSYSPVRASDGTVLGVIDISVETTAQVVTARRQELLARLNHALAGVQRTDELVPVAAEVLAAAPHDLVAVDLTRLEVGGDPQLSPTTDVTGEPDLRVEQTGDGVVAWVPVRTAGGVAQIEITLSPMLAPEKDYLDFLRLIGFAVETHLRRLATQDAERQLSMALQLSLLTEPPTSAYAEIAVRYQPAAELAQVGGDWYDAFALPSGDLAVVVGDVAGHDHGSAAIMGQLRNLVRGIACTQEHGPASVVAGLDRTMDGLGVGVVATALFGTIAADQETGATTLTWSNAGHPPPAVIAPDGSVSLLARAPDPLLGVAPTVERHDHVVALQPGTTIVLYSDGLVERRGVAIDLSLEWLVSTLTAAGEHDPEAVCDHLLAQLGGHTEDDVALLVMRVPG